MDEINKYISKKRSKKGDLMGVFMMAIVEMAKEKVR